MVSHRRSRICDLCNPQPSSGPVVAASRPDKCSISGNNVWSNSVELLQSIRMFNPCRKAWKRWLKTYDENIFFIMTNIKTLGKCQCQPFGYGTGSTNSSTQTNQLFGDRMKPWNEMHPRMYPNEPIK
jgi:hypothetical protein